ncbi:tRNA (N6-threonylcarbamoyladenosine(37)-N6)-methyltransferase TrmO [Fusobacterium sp. MFO224]|uniref:tRNA (N6-threonylcarbamoyladenosine(37)-N6)-methyltransferase TrmO n=1 Tax=Fusobacterium sp. MFO224 TaxID=3378070 RepID=UPI003852DBD9
MKIVFEPIGYINSEFKKLEEIPTQSVLASEKLGKIELLDKFKNGLLGLEKGMDIIVLFNFHESKDYKLVQTPCYTKEQKGVFSIRSPFRPNGIGMSIVKIESIKDNIIEFRGLDMLDKTPVLDIKPYVASLNPKK